jgi:hypothetical protein
MNRVSRRAVPHAGSSHPTGALWRGSPWLRGCARPSGVSNQPQIVALRPSLRRQFEQLVLAAVGDARLYKTVDWITSTDPYRMRGYGSRCRRGPTGLGRKMIANTKPKPSSAVLISGSSLGIGVWSGGSAMLLIAASHQSAKSSACAAPILFGCAVGQISG